LFLLDSSLSYSLEISNASGIGFRWKVRLWCVCMKWFIIHPEHSFPIFVDNIQNTVKRNFVLIKDVLLYAWKFSENIIFLLPHSSITKYTPFRIQLNYVSVKNLYSNKWTSKKLVLSCKIVNYWFEPRENKYKLIFYWGKLLKYTFAWKL
jgi:hypothetical protein